MQSLEAASEQADHLLQIAATRPHTVHSPSAASINGKTLSIHQKLKQIYLEESAKASSKSSQLLRGRSRLLEKLVAREHLNTLVLNLYPGSKGYSLSIKMGRDELVEAVKLPYHEDQLLTYIDNEELPPALTDLLEQADLYYSGCVIVQVRDYRRSVSCETHHVLLRPTTQSVINDVNMITAEGDWTMEERLAVGSQLVIATAGPLCLDPSPAVGLINLRLHRQRHSINTPGLRCTARRQSHVAVNRKRKLDELIAKPLPHLAEFISQRKTQQPRHSQQPNTPKKPKKEVERDYLSDVLRLAKPIEKPSETIDCTPLLVEEYILETERGPGKIYYIKLSILQRSSNSEYLGQLYVDKEYKEGESNGASCRFSLGSRAQANRYIQQFTEIFTEEGRKSVRITHLIPGHPARMICTAGMRERDAKMAAQVQQQNLNFKQLQVMNAMAQQQQLTRCVQKVLQSDGSTIPNGLTLHNGSLTNGEVPSLSTITQQTQPAKPKIMSNSAISALANDLQNSAQKFQQQKQAAANAATAASSSTNTASSINFVNNHHSNAAIISLLNSNSSSSTATSTLNQLLNNVTATRKMTLTNIINPRSIAINPSTTQPPSQPVRVSLSSLTNQLSSPPLSQQKVQTGRLVSSTQTMGVQYSALGGTSGVRRLSDTSATAQSTASLGLSGLSALLAGTPSADNPVPGPANSGSALLERLSTPPSYTASSPKPPPAPSNSTPSILASVQGALASIPGLQNVQVSIPVAVPLSMSLNNSSSHIVTSLPVTASLPVSIMTSTNLTVSGNSPSATLVFTNSSPVTAQLLPQGKNAAAGQAMRTPATCNIGGQSIQLVGTLQRPRAVTTQRHTGTLRVSPASTVVRTADVGSTSGQVLTLSPHPQLQLQALQKQAQLQHQRRRSAADNK